jgi:hypothetical protein
VVPGDTPDDLAIILCAIAVFPSKRSVNATRGADWKVLAGFVADRRHPHHAVYHAPRTLDRGIRRSHSDAAETLCPKALAGLRDLTMLGSRAEDANLNAGHSR